MKKIKFDGKLKLNKKTIARLNDDQMSNVVGGSVPTAQTFCGTCTCPTWTENTCARACTDNCSNYCTVAPYC